MHLNRDGKRLAYIFCSQKKYNIFTLKKVSQVMKFGIIPYHLYIQ